MQFSGRFVVNTGMFYKYSVMKIVGVLVLSLWFGMVMAQTSPGAVDNYSGSASAWLNPSNISTTFVHDDLGLMAYSFSLDNDFAYLPPRAFWPSLRNLMSEGGTWATFEGVQEGYPYYYLYTPDETQRHAYQALDVVFPSMMMTFARNHAVAFSMRSRLCTSATKMPWEIPVLITESLEYPEMQLRRFMSKGMRFSTMAWEEADLSYSTRLFDYGDVRMDVGVTGKLLMGMAGMALNTDSLDYMVMGKDNLHFFYLDSGVRMALPLAYDVAFRDVDHFLKITDPLIKGLGAGADVGFTLTNKKSVMVRYTEQSACDDRPEYYFWRLGVSLLDLGRIRFNSNVMQGQLVGSSFAVNLKDFDAVTSIDEVMSLLDSEVGNTTSAFVADQAFSIGLPTALSVQFDMNLYDGLYCNMTWVQPVSRWLYDASVEREPLLSLTPRYESSLVGVSLPVSLLNYHYVTAGMFLRVGPVTLGTNDLISLSGMGKTRSVDFFVALRLKLDRGDCLFGRLYDACGDKVRRR